MVTKYEQLRELDKSIINAVIGELTNDEIADNIGYSVGAIKRKLSDFYKLYGVKSKVGLVREVLRELNSRWLNSI